MAASSASSGGTAGGKSNSGGGKQSGPTAEQVTPEAGGEPRSPGLPGLGRGGGGRGGVGMRRLIARSPEPSAATRAAPISGNTSSNAIAAVRRHDGTRHGEGENHTTFIYFFCSRFIRWCESDELASCVCADPSPRPLSQISKIVESLNAQMQTKGRELNEYRERYNIRLVGEEEGAGKAAGSANRESDGGGGGSKGGAGVLVS
nr:PREDICTED: prefoldin subunit 2 [Lepisosteus oculatus]